ncbi:MAG TPA: hypothetical protein VGI70_08025 [Polyangiales bacterium]|jgi:hypothetical protein
MQVVYRAHNLAEAEHARDVLVGAGIPTHISERMVSDRVQVLVDNRRVDGARRAIAAWTHRKTTDS